MLVFVLSLLLLVVAVDGQIVCEPPIGTPINQPLGEAKGIYPGRVVWYHDPSVTLWDGVTGFWWEESNTDLYKVESMLAQTLQKLSGGETMADAWDMLFRHFNQEHFGEDRGYVQGEKVAIKINLNTDWPNDNHTYENNNGNSLSPHFLKALLRTLTSDAGIDQDSISVYDAARLFVPYLYDPPTGCHTEFPLVHYVDNQGMEGREQAVPDPNTPFYFSNSTLVANADMTQLPTCATQASYMIAVDNFRGHDVAGVTLTGKNWFGSINRPCCPDPYCGSMVDGVCECGAPGQWCPASLHGLINVTAMPMGSYSPLVDLLGHNKLAGNAVVILMDGLYGGPDEQPWTLPVHFVSTPFNDHWSSSIFASQDPIAIDSVAFDLLRNEPNIPYASSGCVDNYLTEAALASNPPSGTVYNPTGSAPLSSLGVHEHWNNDQDKLYSRNLGTGDGVELVTLS